MRGALLLGRAFTIRDRSQTPDFQVHGGEPPQVRPRRSQKIPDGITRDTHPRAPIYIGGLVFHLLTTAREPRRFHHSMTIFQPHLTEREKNENSE